MKNTLVINYVIIREQNLTEMSNNIKIIERFEERLVFAEYDSHRPRWQKRIESSQYTICIPRKVSNDAASCDNVSRTRRVSL